MKGSVSRTAVLRTPRQVPLNAITGFSQLLSLPDGMIPAEEKDEFSRHIVNNTKMLTMLLDDILHASDTGPGIPEDQAERIFERYVKLDDFVQGTGLGLSICRDIASRLRVLRAYEQSRISLSAASAGHIIRLSRALSCTPEQLAG